METPFLHMWGQKMVISRGFSKFFFRTTGFQLKLIILIEFPNIFHWKPATKKKKENGCGLGAKFGPN